MKLNDDQLFAIEQMKLFMNSSGSFFLLSGYAGTGKTTVIQHFTNMLPAMTIAMTAPTNKAVKVMKTMASKDTGNQSIEYLTTYKVLDLTMGFEDDEKVIIAKEGINNKIKDYNLIVIDEASQISSKLYALLRTIAKKFRVKIIFLGDPAQLPPVNEVISPIFVEEQNIPTVELTKVMRVAGGNPLMLVIDKVRERVLTPDLWGNYIDLDDSFNSDRSEGYFKLDRDKWLATMIKAFSSDCSKENPDFVRAIAWTNRAVDSLNNFVRQNIYEEANTPYLIGERLIAKDSIFAKGSDEILITNSSEMEIILAESTIDDQGFAVWKILVKTDEGKRHYLTVLDRKDANTSRRYDRLLSELAEQARDETAGWKRQMAWGKFWALKEKTYASVNYAYALTSHKSQGSTFSHVFVNQSDILRNPNHKERYQSLYVAYSRASQRVMACE